MSRAKHIDQNAIPAMALARVGALSTNCHGEFFGICTSQKTKIRLIFVATTGMATEYMLNRVSNAPSKLSHSERRRMRFRLSEHAVGLTQPMPAPC